MLIWFFKFFSSSFIAHEASFVLQHNPDGKCFHKDYLDTKGYVYPGVYTCDYEKQSFHWIYTKYRQLLHWGTLKCMADYKYDDYRNKHLVVLKECDRDKQEQLWQCVDDKKNTIMKVNSSKYITYRNHIGTIDPKQFGVSQSARHDTQQSVCSQGNSENNIKKHDWETISADFHNRNTIKMCMCIHGATKPSSPLRHGGGANDFHTLHSFSNITSKIP